MEDLNRNIKLTIGTSLVLVSESQDEPTERIELVLVNNSTGTQKITLSFDNSAVDGVGMVLSPGGNLVMSKDAGYKCNQSRLMAIADGAGAILSGYERVRIR